VRGSTVAGSCSGGAASSAIVAPARHGISLGLGVDRAEGER
jgi:hypothetical protein